MLNSQIFGIMEVWRQECGAGVYEIMGTDLNHGANQVGRLRHVEVHRADGHGGENKRDGRQAEPRLRVAGARVDFDKSEQNDTDCKNEDVGRPSTDLQQSL